MQNTKTVHEKKKQEDKLAKIFDTNYDKNNNSNEDYQKPINFRSSFSVLNFGTCPIYRVSHLKLTQVIWLC